MLNCKITAGQNLCKYYVSLIHQRKNFELECCESLKKYDNEKIKQVDEMRVEFRFKARYVLRDYIEELNEELDLFMKIIEDISAELIEKQCNNVNIEEVLKVQEQALAALELQNKKTEKRVNEEIMSIREKFATKQGELKEAKRNFIVTKDNTEQLCLKENALEMEIAKMRRIYCQNKCCIKAIQAQFETDSCATEQMVEKMQSRKDKYLKLCKETQSYIACHKEMICKLEQEMEIVRKTAIRKLKVTKLHDDWKMEKLVAIKKRLEDEYKDLTDSFGEGEDVQRLRTDIVLMERDVNEAHETIERLRTYLKKFGEHPSVCKKIIRSSTRGKPPMSSEQKKYAANRILARDHLGSTFIKLLR